MTRLGPVLVVAVLAVSAPSNTMAQLTDARRAGLIAEIESAAENVDPSRFPGLEQSKQSFLTRVSEAKGYFDRAADPANRDAWMKYLQLDPLVTAIESDDSPARIAREAIDLRFRLIGVAPGLESTALRNLRDAVEQLIEGIRYRDPEASQDSFSKRLISLAERVEQLDDNPSADDAAAVSALVRVVAGSGQGENVVQSMRNTFNQPNVSILIGESMVKTVIDQDVEQPRPVRDCILGTRIFGDAVLSGRVSANIVPSLGTARIDLSLIGQVVSNNRGYNGPVRLRTIGVGDVNIVRTMTFGTNGIQFGPAHGDVKLSTRITAIEHKLGIVRKIARKRAARQKTQADRIAARRTRDQVAKEFESRTSNMMVAKPRNFADEMRPLLHRLSLEEPVQSWGSDDDSFYIDAMLRRGDQLASVVTRPSVTAPYELALQVHESAIDNAFAPVLSGRTFNERQLAELLDKAGRSLPESTDDSESGAPFEIDFASLRPIIFEARDRTIRLGVRGSRFAQGDSELKLRAGQVMEITALYEPSQLPDGTVILKRVGEVNVDFPGRGRLTVGQIGMRQTIKKKFSRVFPEVFLDRALEIPSDAKMVSLRGRAFHPHHVDADGGWLTIALR